MIEQVEEVNSIHERYAPKVHNELVPFMKFKRSDNPYTYYTITGIKWILDNPNFSNSEKVSIAYLATFQSYNGKLVSNNRIALDKKMIQQYIGIKHISTFNTFYKNLFSQGIIAEGYQGLYFNNDIALKRGKYGIGKHDDDVKLAKIFNKPLEYLYKNNAPKTLYPILALAPYIVPVETRVDLSLAEITFLCGYSNTRSCGRQLKLMELENGERVFIKKDNEILINPNLVKS
ncbi:hypothetical protein [Niallia sp. RD1]|uniref:hypothetical protein n=1 Tax=Niallia sp. RD1 TaxID=2962858 RepID=UPI0020C1B650|nr:hypothetical protein [Niallia sp. RD1]UTI43736.1 hypothetical protein NKG37_08785 [Niallia sp. RD1]